MTDERTPEPEHGHDRACCAPSAAPAARAAEVGAGTVPTGIAPGPGSGQARIRPAASPHSALPGGTFLMGSVDPLAYPEDGEGPVRPVDVAPFSIEAQCVSNARFAAFVAVTGYVTDSEHFGASFVFAGLLPDDAPPTRAVAAAPWWREVPNASWRQPSGSGSTWEDVPDHPVVHVSWHDAQAFCAWAGARLPTEAEWEFAARGGLEQQRFPWGMSLRPGGEHRMNVWQGRFPYENTAADGYVGTAPVDAFPPNGYGLHNMTGNVWEWTADPFAPVGEPAGDRRALRGGSYLCHASYCRRYRVSARMGNTPDSASGNTGFRCARDVEHRGSRAGREDEDEARPR